MASLQNTQSSFKRQTVETVIIQQEAGRHNILNSKSEYNSRSLPRLETIISRHLHHARAEERKSRRGPLAFQDQDHQERCKARLAPDTNQYTSKMQKTEEAYVSIRRMWGNNSKKRECEENRSPGRKRTRVEEETPPTDDRKEDDTEDHRIGT